MATYLLTWNPNRWPWPQDDYDREVRKTTAGHRVRTSWTCGNNKSIVRGDRVFLLRQKRDRGILSSGLVTRGSYKDEHWEPERAAKGDKVLRVDYLSEALLPVASRLPIEELIEAKIDVPWHRILASGISVPEENEDRLASLWGRHLRKIGWHRQGRMTELLAAPPQQEAVLAALEGGSYRREAIFRERNQALIELKKRSSDGRCSVCLLRFADRYTGITRLCLVAHHADPIGQRKKASKTTLADIDLLCPNCHAAVHTEDPPLTADELRSRLID
jgi:5-methylcytosine-specific restriction protein A